MFNIYYINYAKAYEIAMLLDNKILEQITKEHDIKGKINGDAEVETKESKDIPLIGKYLPQLALSGELSGSKSSKVIDTVKVITTKSTILDIIYKKAKEVIKLGDKSIGNLIKIKNVSLEIENENDILGAKTFLSGAIGNIAVEGVGNVNLPTLLEVLFKDSAYILEGMLPEKRFGKCERIMLKIPMQAENEMENQYSLSDLEIGKVTVVGIYRGCFKRKELNAKLNRFERDQENALEDIEIEGDEEINEETNLVKSLEDNIHYIDVISIVQDISF